MLSIFLFAFLIFIFILSKSVICSCFAFPFFFRCVFYVTFFTQPPSTLHIHTSTHHTQTYNTGEKKKFCVTCELESFVPSMLLNGRKIHKPINLFRNLSKINDLLTPGCQEDAHEFLQALLDKIEMAYDDSYFNLHNKNKEFKKDPFNPIRRLFVGSTKTTVMCSKCRTVTSTEEPFSCVSLDVDPDVTLTESLSMFTNNELLRGDSKYYCEQCKRKVIARKQLTLAKLPPNLIFHFKRFKLESYSSHQRELSMKKLCDRIEFPNELDFNEFLDMVIDPSHQNDVSQDSVYELYGIVVHSGPKLGYGHYYAFIKSFDGKQWFRMNDMEVLPINEIKVLKEQAYLLFYRRKSHRALENEMNQIKVQMMMDQNGKLKAAQAQAQQVQRQKQGGAANANVNGANNNSQQKDANGNKYKWQHQSSSPTQVKSIPTNFEEKMDATMLNDGYFMSSCGNDTSDVIAMNDRQKQNGNGDDASQNVKNKQFSSNNNSNNKMNKSGLKTGMSDKASNDDRGQFVMVPAMATRSDISALNESDENSQNSNDDMNGNSNKAIEDHQRRAKIMNNGFQEVFWPVQDID